MRVRRFPFVIAALPVLAATTVSTAEAPPANTILIIADRIPHETDTLDNTVLVTFLPDPADYATEIPEGNCLGHDRDRLRGLEDG